MNDVSMAGGNSRGVAEAKPRTHVADVLDNIRTTNDRLFALAQGLEGVVDRVRGPSSNGNTNGAVASQPAVAPEGYIASMMDMHETTRHFLNRIDTALSRLAEVM